MCVVEPAAVTLLTVDAVGAVQIDVTQSRDTATADGLSHWLSDVLNGDRREPDSLLLLGSRSDRDQLTGPLDEALPMPVISTAEAQLVLARGAALALATHTVATNVVDAVVEEDETPAEDSRHPDVLDLVAHPDDGDPRCGRSGGRCGCLPRASSTPRPGIPLADGKPSGRRCFNPNARPGIRATGHGVPHSTTHAPPPPVQPLFAEPPQGRRSRPKLPKALRCRK